MEDLFTGDIERDAAAMRKISNRETSISETSGFLKNFFRLSLGHVGDEWIENDFKNIDNDYDRVLAVYTHPKFKKYLHEVLCCVTPFSRNRNVVLAKMKRVEASKLLRAHEYEDALRLANAAILLSPGTSDMEAIDYGSSLLLSYLKRAEVFICMSDYERAYEDLCLADEIKDARLKMDNVIELRKNFVKKRMEKTDVKIPAPFNEFELYPVIATRRELPEIIGERHPVMVNASAKLDVRYTEQAGNEIYAKERIRTGEVLVVEEPLVWYLLNNFHGDHCTHCLDRLFAPLGCPNCFDIAFCSRKCRDIALSTYHKYECRLQNLMDGSGMSTACYLAFRGVAKEGLDNCLKIYDALNKTDDKTDDKKDGGEKKLSKSAKRRLRKKMASSNMASNLSENLASMSLKESEKEPEKKIDTTLYELFNHSSQRETTDLFFRTLVAAFLLRCLQKVNFFKTTSGDDDVPNDEELKVASLILNTMQSIPFNCHMVYETKFTGNEFLPRRHIVTTAVAIYPTARLFNHECAPAVARYNIQKGVIIRAARPFQPGESIPDSYGPCFERDPYTQRQVTLLGRYWFKCKCKPCEEMWPLGKYMNNSLTKIRCKTWGCYKTHFMDKIQEKLMFCNMCRKKVDMYDVLTTLHLIEDSFNEALNLSETNEIIRAIGILLKNIEEFYEIAIQPHYLTIKAQIVLCKLYGFFGNNYKFPQPKPIKEKKDSYPVPEAILELEKAEEMEREMEEGKKQTEEEGQKQTEEEGQKQTEEEGKKKKRKGKKKVQIQEEGEKQSEKED
ncbi:PREDICTED: SET and MYND domain-containing protein 4-like [Polistes dominula]|uniref:Protein-lysine N-methyltransferase SMYD4 n=1 Tax=Polistes dominula TaxID=743375 RepID=A0ABM1ILT7_POLDO|nr:PREDICTED: SET and MYND domain-containing protein 4-like [Polistes dominula]